MAARPFIAIDTNVLVYAYDAREPERGRQARDLLARLEKERLGAFPVQVLCEFARVAMERLSPPLTPDEALVRVQNLAASWPVLPLDPVVVMDAVRGVRDHGMSYFDAQIWAAARLGGCRVVLSEDFADGRECEGVRFQNPFAEGFEIEGLLGAL